MWLEFEEMPSGGQKVKRFIFCCKECQYFKPYKDASGYGTCQSKHTFDGAFRETDYCSYAKPKDTQN